MKFYLSAMCRILVMSGLLLISSADLLVATSLSRVPWEAGTLKAKVPAPFEFATVDYSAMIDKDGKAIFKTLVIRTGLFVLTVPPEVLVKFDGALPWTLRIGTEPEIESSPALISVEFRIYGLDLDGGTDVTNLPLGRINLTADGAVRRMIVFPEGGATLETLDIPRKNLRRVKK